MSAAHAAVTGGRIQGTESSDGEVRAFLGVPYAAPPTGELRWRPPHPVRPWAGTRAAVRFAPSAPQPRVPANSLYYGGEDDFSEDCLYLNVWAGPTGGSARPVLVWFHFGGFQFGSASNPLYDGTALARQGAIVVGVNYRLGRLGFLAHPWLSAESDRGVSGNYGLQDQLAALRWVQENIEAFGGDPSRVTIMGVSAGGHSVHNLRATGLAEGLFHRAVAHSAPGVAPVLDGPGHPASVQTLAAGEQAGSELTDVLAVRNAAQLRALPAEALAAVALPRSQGPWTFDLIPGASTSMHVFDSAYPIVDGYVLPESPFTAYQSGRALDVPMIVGNVGNEGSGLPCLQNVSDYHDYVRAEYGVHADRLLDLYPAVCDSDVPEASRALEGDRIFVWSNWTAARLQSRTDRSPVWRYLFHRRPPIRTDSDIAEKSFAGAFHGADLPYLFDTHGVWDWPWTAADRALGHQMRSAWLAFALTGDPTSEIGSAPAMVWPAFSEERPRTLIWDVAGPAVSEPQLDQRMAAFDAVHGLATLERLQ